MSEMKCRFRGAGGVGGAQRPPPAAHQIQRRAARDLLACLLAWFLLCKALKTKSHKSHRSHEGATRNFPKMALPGKTLKALSGSVGLTPYWWAAGVAHNRECLEAMSPLAPNPAGVVN